MELFLGSEAFAWSPNVPEKCESKGRDGRGHHSLHI